MGMLCLATSAASVLASDRELVCVVTAVATPPLASPSPVTATNPTASRVGFTQNRFILVPPYLLWLLGVRSDAASHNRQCRAELRSCAKGCGGLTAGS